MDLYGDDRNLSELNEELNEFLDHDNFTSTNSDSSCGIDTYTPTGMDEDWLDSFFEDPVLNDRMISDALQPPAIRHEHSYSMANSTDTPNSTESPLLLIKPEPMDQDLDADILACPTTSNTQLTLNFTPMTLKTHQNQQTTLLNQEQNKDSTSKFHTSECGTTVVAAHTATTVMTTHRTAHQATTIVKQPTIILATTSSLSAAGHHSATGSGGGTQQTKTERLVLPKVNIKVELQDTQQSPEHMDSYHTLDLPPTPPSSAGSDSDGSTSPSRSAPSSPVRQGGLRHAIRANQASLFSSPIRISQSGMLMLSEEERRTLVSEGYPIPQKLPLTKQEEKNLKKIRRKIKNKISAQESRRKKKEYLETLEKKVEVYNQENVDLKKKMESLENNNRSLLSQLQKLQSIVSKVTKQPNSTQNTCLMVFVLCFAVFLGSWSPANFSIGQSRAAGAPSPVKIAMGPVAKGVQVDAYTTANLRSRVLLSMKEEAEEGFDHYGPATPFSYREMLISFFHGSGGLLATNPKQEAATVAAAQLSTYETLDPEMPQVHITDAQSVRNANLHNETGDRKLPPSAAAPPHPDITADVPAPIDHTPL